MKNKAKEFEKGWEQYQVEKKKEIEEIAKVLCDNNCYSCTGLNCLALINAEKIYNAGYRKLTVIFNIVAENIVYNDDAGFDVLTKDRAEELAKHFGVEIKEQD